MKFVLDTNVVSELRKIRSGKAEPRVAAWAQTVNTADLFVSVITILELEQCICGLQPAPWCTA